MALFIPEGYAEVAIQMKRAGDPDPWYVTYGVGDVPTPDQYPSFAGQIMAIWNSNFSGLLPTDTAFTGIQLRIGTDSGTPLTIFYAINYQGSGSGTTLPQNCAVLVTKVTGVAGRRGKGRLFWPCILEDEVNGLGQIEPDYRDALQAIWDTFIAEHVNGNATFDGARIFLLHNERPGLSNDPSQVSYFFVDPVISTQRKRLRK